MFNKGSKEVDDSVDISQLASFMKRVPEHRHEQARDFGMHVLMFGQHGDVVLPFTKNARALAGRASGGTPHRTEDADGCC